MIFGSSLWKFSKLMALAHDSSRKPNYETHVQFGVQQRRGMYRCICILCFSICTWSHHSVVHSTIILWFFSPYSSLSLSYSLIVSVDMVSQNLNAPSFRYTAGSVLVDNASSCGKRGSRDSLRQITTQKCHFAVHNGIDPSSVPTYRREPLIFNSQHFTNRSAFSNLHDSLQIQNLLSLVTSCIYIYIIPHFFSYPSHRLDIAVPDNGM